MITRPAIIGLATFFFAAPALAAADLNVSIPAPSPEYVYDTTAYDVVVSNIGNKSASGVVLTIELPETNTSPNVYVMGTLGGVDPRCSLSGTTLTCNLGSIARNTATTVSFGIDLPQADQTLMISASATSSSPENTLANNSASDIAPLLNYDVAVSAGDIASISHCTGQGLTSFFECERYPSSISMHEHEFLADGQIAIAEDPSLTGSWSQPTSDSLVFTYEQGGFVVAEFEGWGTTPDCFEGITTFPGSSWVAPYEVCI